MGKLTICEDCKEVVSMKAKSCPHCGAPIKKKASGCVKTFNYTAIGIGVLFWVVLIGTWESATEEPEQNSEPKIEKKETPWNQKDERISAYIMCEGFVEDRLKSPSTADFESIWSGRNERIIRTGQRYKVESYVDSQNSFGATVRTQFTCIVTQTNEGEWTLNTLEFEQ